MYQISERALSVMVKLPSSTPNDPGSNPSKSEFTWPR
jgi:hypothetical protein